MENSDLDNHVHHVFWTLHGDPIGKKMDDSHEDRLNYRLCENPKYLQNVLKKYIGTPEEIKEAFEKDSLRVVLGISVKPIPGG